MLLHSLVLAAIPATQSTSAASEALGHSARRYSLEQILGAIRAIESGGQPDEGRNAKGDGGRAIGPFQIHRTHWQDSRLPGRFDDCRDPRYARRAVIAYWKRWCPKALERLDAETLARVHNGGPNGARKTSTLKFWHKVRSVLDRGTTGDPRVVSKTAGTSGGGRSTARE